jgi:hypothetical protein
MPTTSEHTGTVFVRIELTPQAKERVEQLSDEPGMTQFAILSRLAAWFSKQHPTVQAVVLGQYPRELSAEIAKMLLRRSSPRF